MNANAMVDRFFLTMRAWVLEIGAIRDRIDRAPGAERLAGDERLHLLADAMGVLTDGKPDRAARIQMVFSDPYDPKWQRPTKPRS